MMMKETWEMLKCSECNYFRYKTEREYKEGIVENRECESCGSPNNKKKKKG